MNIRIFALVAAIVTVIASSQAEKQASLLHYIEAGDLEHVKALICPSDVEPLFGEDLSMSCISPEETQPAKKRRLYIEPLPANLNNNEALNTAISRKQTRIVKYLITLPDVVDTAKVNHDLALELAELAVDHGYDEIALEMSKFCSVVGLRQLFMAMADGERPKFLGQLLWDDRLDLNHCSTFLLHRIIPAGHPYHSIEDHYKSRAIVELLISHERLASIDYDRVSLLIKAAEMDFPDVFAILLKNPKLVITSDLVNSGLLKFEHQLYWSMLLALYRTISSDEIGNFTTTVQDLIQLMILFKSSTVQEIKANENAKFAIHTTRQYMTMLCQACVDRDMVKLTFLLESYPEFDNPIILSGLSIMLSCLDYSEVAITVLKHHAQFHPRKFPSLEYTMNYLNNQRNGLVLYHIYDRFIDSIPKISIRRRMFEDYLSRDNQPDTIQNIFNLLSSADEVAQELHGKGTLALEKFVGDFFSFYALRLTFAESDRIMPPEIFQTLLEQGFYDF